MKKIILGLCSVGLASCTSVQVKPVASNEINAIDQICIVSNPAVTIDNFVSVIEKRIQYNGIRTIILNAEDARKCKYQLTYSARRSWDGVTYLSWAELKLYKNSYPIGDAEYRLKGKGGLSLTKWQSVETKMNPVVDELFAGKIKNQNNATNSAKEQILNPQKVKSVE
ncbi:Sbal_3080 family lipoprotein [Acinetobacter ursingii]|uniref:Sbal_3080 family lipoprotein n=1 Tax=Acinetobacter ursingii TaxID=108980 RepID=UPI00300AA952